MRAFDLTVTGSIFISGSTKFQEDATIDAAANINLDADGAVIKLKDGGTEFGRLSRVSSDLVIKSSGNNNDMLFKGVDGGGTITALTLDMSEGGRAIFLSDVSGSSTSTGSFGEVNVAELSIPSVKTLSSSIATGIASNTSNRTSLSSSVAADVASNLSTINTLKGSGTTQGVGQGNSPTFAAGTITGDLSVGGTLTAQEVHTEFESASILFTSGSTQFGNSIDDIHRMTGSLLMTGSMVVGAGKGISPLGEFDVSVNTAGSRRFTVSFEDSLVSLSAKNGSNNGEVLKLMGDDLVIHTGTNTSGTEKMRIDTAGNVGIGTNDPDEQLHLYSTGANSPNILIQNENDSAGESAAAGGIEFYLKDDNGSNPDFQDLGIIRWTGHDKDNPYNKFTAAAITGSADDPGNSSGRIDLNVAYSDSMINAMAIRAAAAGDARVGIGTTGPASKLEVEDSDGTQYSGTAEPRETMIIQNPSGSDNTAVGLHSTLGFQVADGATSQGFINYVRTGNNTGAFTLSQRAGSSTYAESMRLESGGDIGVGTTNPDGRFHIHNNSAGSVTANGDANELVIENNGTTGISILCPAANQAEIAFGDPDDNNVGRFAYNHPGDYFALVAGASEIMRISGSGNVHLPDNPARFGVGADVDPRAGSSFDVIQVGHTSQWYAETANAADRNVYIGNNFYHNGSYHRAIYEDQVCGIQFRAGDIRFRTTGSVPVTTNLEGGGGRSRMVVHDDGRVSVGYDQTGEHDLEHNSALVVSSSGNSGPLSRNAMTVVGFCGAGSFNYGSSTVTFDNIKGDGPCFTLRNLGTSHTDRGPFQVYNGSTRILETRNDGLISGDFNDTSDRDFKQNINSITSSLKEVNELRPVTFVWKQDEENGQNRGHGQTKIGFIAQEVSESIPRLVSGVSGSSSGLGINTIGVTAVLTKAIQELTQAHKDLRAMITGSSDLGQLKALVSGSSFV